MPSLEEQEHRLKTALAGLEAQREVLGDAVVEPALQALRQQLAELRRGVEGPVPPSLEGERKLVTVMFADISGYTALAERLDPERARDLINDCFEQLVPVVERYGGTVDKFVGDAIVALFGAPAVHENDPERALRAAIEMAEALVDFNATNGTDLGLHFGINTGPVVAGGVGSKEHQEYSVIGHPVNLAARLEDASERGEIFVGPATYRLTAPLFRFEAVGPLRLKGASGPTAVYRLLGVKAVPGPVRGIEGLRSPLVGRESELSRLLKALRDLQEGSGGVLVLTGEAGVGKSRLVAEARRTLSGDLDWCEGRALSYTQGMSYWMIRDLLRALIEVTPHEQASVQGIALRVTLERLFPEEAAMTHAPLARLLDVPLEPGMEERLRYLSAEALQREIGRAVARIVRARALEKPLVLVCEDLHWADPSSLHLLRAYLLPLLEGRLPLVLLLVFRQEEGLARELHQDAAAMIGARYQLIELDPLSREDSRRLLHNLLEIDNLAEATQKLILQKAEGNAFFLEEVLRSLIDAGAVEVKGERAVATRTIGEIELPDTLQGVVGARIDRLGPAHKRTLQTASVIGRVFQQHLLTRLIEQRVADETLRETLRELLVREFIRLYAASVGDGATTVREPEYIFKHAVTQEVAYHSLLIKRRKELHRRVGEIIEALWPDQLDEQAATLGYHFQRAEVPDKAVRYLTRAGERARATYANPEAIAFYRAAIEQIDDLGKDAGGSPGEWRDAATRLHEKVGDLLELVGRHEEARAAHQNALGGVGDDRLRMSRLYRKTAKTWESQREFEEALRTYDRAEASLGSETSGFGRGEWEEWLEIRLERIWAHYFRAEVDEISRQVEEIRPLVERHGSPAQRSLFFLRLVLMAFRRDRYVISEETLAHARASLTWAEESGELLKMGHPRFVLGLSHLCRRELNSADEHLRAALSIAEKTGDVTLQSRSLTYFVVVHRMRGQVEQARRAIAHVLEVASIGQMVEYVAMAKANQAWVAWREGSLSEARSEAEAALELWGQSWTAYPFKWAALWPLIAISVAGDDLARAIEHARALLEPTQQPLPERLAAAVENALRSWEAQQPQSARAALVAGVDLAGEMGFL